MKGRIVAIAAVSLGALTACGASAPPAAELADELIDTLEQNGVPVSDEVKDCMHEVVADFALSEEDAQGFDNLTDVADKADNGNERAIEILADFQADLASCN